MTGVSYGPGARLTLAVLLVVAALTVVARPAGVGAATAPECMTANADGSYTVPFDWALKPPDLARGERFRLLFITSLQRVAADPGLSVYDTFVQNAAKAGHPAVSDSCAGLFRVVGSSSSTDARDHTDTTGVGVPIYWLKGARLADDYADFYDGDWDDYGMTAQNGQRVSYEWVFTGSKDDGTRSDSDEEPDHFVLGNSHGSSELNRIFVDERAATGDPSGREGNPLSGGLRFTADPGRFYALSPVFAVENPTIGFGETAVNVNEGETTVNLRIELSHPRAEATTFSVTTTDGTANATADYTPGPYSGDIPAGETETTVSIGITNDAVAEVRKNFTAQITDPSDGVDEAPEHATADITIVDNDGTGRLVFTPSGPMELTEGGSQSYTVELSAAPTHDVTVEITSDDPDVTPSPGTLTFMPVTWDTAQTVTVTSREDYDIWDETATLTHVGRSDDPNYDGSGVIRRQKVEVPDSIIRIYPPAISFRDAEITVSEHHEGGVEITLLMDPIAIGLSYVTITATSGTATEGVDFRSSVNHRVDIFGWGNNLGSWRTVYIPLILDDNQLEPDETFTLTLSDPAHAMLGEQSTMTVTIVDDEYTISNAGASRTDVAEDAGHAEIKFKLSKALPRDIRVRFEYTELHLVPGRDFRRVPQITVPAGRTDFTLRIPIIDDDVPNPHQEGQVLIEALPGKVPQGLSPPRVLHNLYIHDDDDDGPNVTTTPTLYEGQTKTITIENVPSSYGRTIQEDRNFYLITKNTAYPFTTTTKHNPDQKCSKYGDYNADGIDICIKDHSWDPDKRVARIRLTALRDRQAEGEEHVYMRFGKYFDYGANTHVFKITVTDYPTEYDQPTNPLPGRRFWCKEPAPTIYDLYPDFTGNSPEGEQRATFLEALSNLRYISPPPPVLVAEWDKPSYDVGETATIRFSAQDKDGKPTRVCGSVTINYFVNSQPESGGGTLPIPKGPRGYHPDWSYLKTISINSGGTEAQASYTIQAEGTLSFHVLNAYTNDRNNSAVQLQVPTLKDGDGNILTRGGDSPPATPVTSASVEMAPAPDPEVRIGGGNGGEEGTPVGFQLVADPAPPGGESLDVAITITAVGEFGVQTGTRAVTIGSSGTAFVDMPTTDDEHDEPNGSVTLTIDLGHGYTLGLPATMTIAILDNDEPGDGGNNGDSIPESQDPDVDYDPPPATPEITISGGSAVTEGGTASFTISASPAPASPISVNVGVSQSGDWGATGPTTVTVSGATTTYTITTSDDQVDEADGSVTATVKSGDGYTVGSASSATVAVADDVVPEITISGGSGVTEGGTASFTISASPAPASPIAVNVGVSQDGDFGAAGAATVTVSGATTAYTITTSDDQVDEADGSVTATVKSGTGYTVGAASAASVVVADDDDPPGPGNSGTLTVSIANPEESAARAEFLKFTVSASEAAQQDVTISYTLSTIGLAPRFDYCVIASGEQPDDDFNCMDLPRDHDSNGGEVTIAAGEDSATIFVWIDRRAWVSAGSQVWVFLREVEGAKEITQGNAYGRVTE